jgi:hypothetical protein
MENRRYRIDPQTGVFAEIGPFKGGRDVMDFATNPKDGAMYATPRRPSTGLIQRAPS